MIPVLKSTDRLQKAQKVHRDRWRDVTTDWAIDWIYGCGRRLQVLCCKASWVHGKSRTLPVLDKWIRRSSTQRRNVLQKRKIMKRGGNKNVLYFLLCKLIRSALKEDLEACNCWKGVMVPWRKQNVKKCKRKLLLCHLTIGIVKIEDEGRITDRTNVEEICRKF